MAPRAAAKAPADAPADVLAAVERAVRAAAPTLTPVRKWGNEWLAGKDLVLSYWAFTHHVGIEFWRGTTLPDPDGLLEGTGKNLRHVKLTTVRAATAAPLRRLIRAAVDLDGIAPPRKR